MATAVVRPGRRSSAAARRRQQEAGRDLRVERLGGRHAHLDVATVGRVEHAVGLVGEVAVAPVDDGDHDRAPRPRARSTVRLVSVVVPDWLIGDDQRVAHVVAQRRSPTARWRAAASTRSARAGARRSASAPARLWPATAAVPWPITSTRRIAPVAQVVDARRAGSASSPSSGAAARRRARRACPAASCGTTSGASVISLSRKCGSRRGRCRAW